mmetsp:Transcript_20527/g.30843  ORF Transcript_20527/g.30843 Transcript_20527/m.30843 type:complete len:116 (-) Transcript_20527:198-545(-)
MTKLSTVLALAISAVLLSLTLAHEDHLSSLRGTQGQQQHKADGADTELQYSLKWECYGMTERPCIRGNHCVWCKSTYSPYPWCAPKGSHGTMAHGTTCIGAVATGDEAAKAATEE